MSIKRVRMMKMNTGLKPGEAGPFGNVIFYQNPLVYDNNAFRLQTSWNEISSYGSKYGKTNGSTYFQWSDVNGVDINGYRLPTNAELTYLISSSRTGSTYNGTSRARYATVTAKVDNATYISGYIFFPDGATITGKNLTVNPSDFSYTTITPSELDALLEQRVLFLPMFGVNAMGSWYYSNSSGHYWSSTPSVNYAFYLSVSGSNGLAVNLNPKTYYQSVMLVREL